MGPVRSSIRTPSLVAHMRLLYACVQLAYIFIQQISGRVLALYALIGIVILKGVVFLLYRECAATATAASQLVEQPATHQYSE